MTFLLLINKATVQLISYFLHQHARQIVIHEYVNYRILIDPRHIEIIK